MGALYGFTPDGKLCWTKTASAEGCVDYLGGGFYLSQPKKTLQSSYVDKNSTLITTLYSFPSGDDTGAGLAINHNRGANQFDADALFDGMMLISARNDSVVSDTSYYLLDYSRPNATDVVRVLNLPDTENHGILFDGQAYFACELDLAGSNYNYIRYEYDGVNFSNCWSVKYQKTLDICFDGQRHIALDLSAVNYLEWSNSGMGLITTWAHGILAPAGITFNGEYVVILGG